MINPLDFLCWYDARNPDCGDLDDDSPPPRVNCFCDNCFYGRNKLALEIIALREGLSAACKKCACLHHKKSDQQHGEECPASKRLTDLLTK